jgi:hypothetical protein
MLHADAAASVLKNSVIIREGLMPVYKYLNTMNQDHLQVADRMVMQNIQENH